MAVSEGSGSSLPWFAEGAGLKERIGGVFRRSEPRRYVALLREGRIGGGARKKGWQLAEDAGDPAPWRMPARRGWTLSDQETARDIGRDYRIAHRGDPSGVLVLDATGCLKKDS